MFSRLYRKKDTVGNPEERVWQSKLPNRLHHLSRHMEDVVLWLPTLVATLAYDCAPFTLQKVEVNNQSKVMVVSLQR